MPAGCHPHLTMPRWCKSGSPHQRRATIPLAAPLKRAVRGLPLAAVAMRLSCCCRADGCGTIAPIPSMAAGPEPQRPNGSAMSRKALPVPCAAPCSASALRPQGGSAVQSPDGDDGALMSADDVSALSLASEKLACHGPVTTNFLHRSIAAWPESLQARAPSPKK